MDSRFIETVRLLIDVAPFVQLEDVRERLFRELPASLYEAERNFLLSVNRCEPDRDILGVTGIENLPAIKWKLLNLGKLAKANPKKYAMILKSLEEKFRGDA